MEHSFDIDIAKEVGINSAIIYKHIQFWCAKNKANDVHFHDNYYWTYNSKKAFVELMPYFTERQIEYAINKLVEHKYIIKGNYNKSPYDKTQWYADIRVETQEQYESFDSTKLCNRTTENVRPIPYNKPYTKTNKVVSKDTTSQAGFEFGKPKEIKRSLYQKCVDLIDSKYSGMNNIRKLLIQYLDLRLEIAKNEGKTLYVNMWSGILNDLDTIHKQGYGLEPTIQQSISKGYKTFYPPASNSTIYSNPDTNKAPQKKADKSILNDSTRKVF